jgi:hypothetical protein
VRLVAVGQAAGAVLGRDVPSPRPAGPPLLTAGAVLSPGCVQHLADAGVARVWVEDGRPGPAELLPEATRAALAARLVALQGLAVGTPLRLPFGTLQELDALAEVALGRVAAPDDRPYPADIAPRATFAARHAVGACALGLLLARHLAARDDAWADGLGRGHRGGLGTGLLRLGAGLLAHDLGRLAAGGGHHAERGARLLADGHLVVAWVVRGHHERWDGHGEPAGIPGPRQARVVRVAAVAAAFDAWVRWAEPEVEDPVAAALERAAAEAGAALDPDVVAALLEVVAPLPALSGAG